MAASLNSPEQSRPNYSDLDEYHRFRDGLIAPGIISRLEDEKFPNQLASFLAEISEQRMNPRNQCLTAGLTDDGGYLVDVYRDNAGDKPPGERY